MKNFYSTLVLVLMALIIRANGFSLKDSLVIRQRKGPDKTRYKVCKGADVKVVFYENGAFKVKSMTPNEKYYYTGISVISYTNETYSSSPENQPLSDSTAPNIQSNIEEPVLAQSAATTSLLYNDSVKAAIKKAKRNERQENTLSKPNSIYVNLADIFNEGFGISYMRAFPSGSHRFSLHIPFSVAGSPRINYGALGNNINKVNAFCLNKRLVDYGIGLYVYTGKAYRALRFYTGPLFRVAKYTGSYESSEIKKFGSAPETTQYSFQLTQYMLSINNGVIIKFDAKLKMILGAAVCVFQNNKFENNDPQYRQNSGTNSNNLYSRNDQYGLFGKNTQWYLGFGYSF